MIVRGRVQGVGYRANCARFAESIGVAGTVRNLPDGSVEVVAEGPPDVIDELITWCRRGPTWAKVSSVDVTDAPAEGLASFRIV